MNNQSQSFESLGSVNNFAATEGLDPVSREALAKYTERLSELRRGTYSQIGEAVLKPEESDTLTTIKHVQV